MDSSRKRPIILNDRLPFASLDMRIRGRRAAAAACATIACVIAVTAAPVRAHEPDADEIALVSLVRAELAFARMGAAEGIRASFLANFADDGVVFEPAPVRLRETWSARPAPADPLASRLEWKPAQAGVARSRDLGYTTGPFTFARAAEPGNVRHGVFFSVWQRDAGGKWQVLLDAGIDTPGVVDFASLGAAPRPGYRGRSNAAAERRKLLEREASAFAPGAADLTPNAYGRIVAHDVRLHRGGSAPLATRAVVVPEVARRMSRVAWTPIDAWISAAADMAVTYGRYRETDRAALAHDGYYAHLWLRDAAGDWRLAYDVALPAR
jgi:hypothetical protein